LELPLLLGALPRSMVPRGALPVPAHGGRSLWVIVVPRVAAPELPPFDGRFEELPNPAGGRPRSEEFPCASHVRPVGRVLDPGLTPALPRGELLLLNPPRLALPSALVRMFEFGLSSESSRCREDIAPPFSGELLKRPELIGIPDCPRLPEFSVPRAPTLPGRSVAGRMVPALNERVGMCEAPGAGLLRATTERF
jgi:hypothetical protein